MDSLMHTVSFYPIGNADTCLIVLNNDRKIIFDYANTHDPDDDADLRIDLEKEIRNSIGSAKKVDVLAFSHLDKDHYQRASDLFWLDHAVKYQGDDRIKIETLWVPVAAIIEYIATIITLEPGDIISTGTIAGVGSTTGNFMQPGDRVEIEISKIGVLRNTVAASKK